jgi:hypothetical protein
MDSASWSSLIEAPGETAARARALAALRAAARGEQRQADALLAELERGARDPAHALDHALDRALDHALGRAFAHLARATLLALDGLAQAADAELMQALGAASERSDPDLVMAALRGLGDVAVVTGTGRRWLASSSALAVPPGAVVLDARCDALTVRGEPRSLRRYPVRRRLLYALARHPGSVLDKDALVAAGWGCAYDPLRHDDLLKATVLHLRRVLADSGVAIACGHPGYRLDAASPFLFLSAFELGRASSPRFTGPALSATDQR